MKYRCKCKSLGHWKYYGGRGITVCDEWEKDFLSFYKWATDNGFSEELELDRRDNSKGYSPENCRWVTCEANNSNTRQNRFITYSGKTQTMSQWARELGICVKKIHYRLKVGWSVERAFSK